MTGVRWEVNGVDEFIADMVAIDNRMIHDFNSDVKKSIKNFTSKWRADAKKKAGKHGKLYPGTIRPEMVGAFEAVSGPISSLPQGGMGRGFEYGTPTTAGRESSNWVFPPIYIGGGKFIGGPRVGQRVGQDTPQMSMNLTADVEFPAFVKTIETTVAKDWR